MPAKKSSRSRAPIVLSPGGGRAYRMGRITSVFKADGDETGGQYSVSEWWLAPKTKGPGTHKNDDDHAWYVIDGTMSIFVGGKWFDAPKGSFVLIPGGVPHDFENRSNRRAGLVSFNSEAGFEEDMPGISQWFAEHPPGRAVARPARRLK